MARVISSHFHIVSWSIAHGSCTVTLSTDIPITEAKFVYFDVYRDYDCFPYQRKEVEINDQQELAVAFAFWVHQKVIFELFFIDTNGQLIGWADSIYFDTEKGIIKNETLRFDF